MPSHMDALTSAYHPAPGSTKYCYSVVVTSTSTSLGSLLNAAGGSSVPLVSIPGNPASGPLGLIDRYPRHVIFMLLSTAANSVFMTWDGNTSPTSALAAPGAPTITPQTAGGGITWTYKLVANYATGGHSAASSAGSTADGEPDLTVMSNGNTITWTDIAGVASYDVYRTVVGTTPNTTGKIGNVLQGVHTLLDNGLAGDSTTAPTSADSIGWEIQKGSGYKFENASDLLAGGSGGPAIRLAPATSFLFAATANTVMSVIFSD